MHPDYDIGDNLNSDDSENEYIPKVYPRDAKHAAEAYNFSLKEYKVVIDLQFEIEKK